MSYRSTILSPLPTYGLGTSPGGSIFTTYSSSYNSRRGSSASRKYDTSGGSSSGYGTSGRPGSRPLPVGPSPLDHAVKKLGSYIASDIRKTSTGSTRGPLRADHSSYLTGGSSKYDYTPSIGTLPRKYSSSNANTALNNTTKDTSLGSRGVRSRSVSNVDKVAENLTQVKLNGYDSVKASPRITDSDDSISGTRESRGDRNEQNLNQINNRSSSRFSHTSKSTLNNNDESFLTPLNPDSTGRTSSIQREIDNKQENDRGISKSLSRQSSSSSISAEMTVKVWNNDKTLGKLVRIKSFEDLVIKAKDKLQINPNVDIKILLEDGCEVDDTDCLVALVTTEVKPPLRLFIIKPTECLCLPSSSSDECCICLDRPKESFLIPCGHSYCTVCAVQLESTTKSCPQCRCEINKLGKLRD